MFDKTSSNSMGADLSVFRYWEVVVRTIKPMVQDRSFTAAWIATDPHWLYVYCKDGRTYTFNRDVVGVAYYAREVFDGTTEETD